MPTRNEVFRIADKLRAAGKRPSYRNVTAALARGGSPRVVLKHLASWWEERAYKPKLEAKGLPEPLQERLVGFAEQTWQAAQEQAATVFQREREAMDETRLAEAEDRECLLGQLEASRAEVGGLRELAAAAQAEAEHLRARLEKVENQLGRFRAEEFWDRVMQEIFEILPSVGTMTAAEVLPELKARTVRGAALHKEPLTAATLRKKMDVRVTHGRYFEAHPDGRFGRRTG
ncbi:KfrA N-terminal DNA-binding domain-containing protein [Methylorubrum aminovorans]